ncbi:MAG: DUF421 domain-containing protein [Tenericutes bacterium]|nr:DUF421 domain-containing protein [Mycoplasmatota bacterium]
MGKREIGELGVIDLIVSFLVAEFVTISIEDVKISIFYSLIPLAILMLCQISISHLSMRSKKVRSLFDEKPSVIINRGKINFPEMLKQRYNIEDLLSQLREKSIKNIEEVDYALLESNGRLSVFKKDLFNKEYPLPIVIDGIIDYETLIQIRKNENWLHKELETKNIELDNIFYAFYRNNSLYIIEHKST